MTKTTVLRSRGVTIVSPLNKFPEINWLITLNKQSQPRSGMVKTAPTLLTDIIAGNVGEEELSGRRQVEAVNGRRQMEGD